MKYSIAMIAFLSIALVGCSKAKESYQKGCEAGISEAVSAWGRQPDQKAISDYCQQAAEKAFK